MSSYYEKMLATGEVKCIDEEVPFEIPQGWEWERFGNIMINKDSERVPLSVAQRQQLKKTYDYYGASGVIDKVDKYLFDKDLLLIGEDGANLINRSTPIAFIAKGKYWVNNHAHVLDVCSGMTLSYVALFINAISLVDYVTGTAQPKMNQEKMNSILLAIPPVKEQHRILEKMSMVDAFVDKYASLQTKLDSLDNSVYELLRKSILQEAIQGKLVPQNAEEGTAQELLEQIEMEKRKLVKEGRLKKSALTTSVIFRGDDNKYYEQIGEKCNDITDEIPFDLPYNWCWCRFSNIASMTIGKTPARGEQIYWINGKYNWVSISDMIDGGLISTTKEKVSDLAVKEVFSAPISEKGCLLMSFKLSIGKTSILNIDAFHNEAIITIRPVIDKEYAMRNYLFKVLPLIANLGESKDAIKGKTLNSKSLANLLIPLPPLQEQQRIIEQMNILSKQLR